MANFEWRRRSFGAAGLSLIVAFAGGACSSDENGATGGSGAQHGSGADGAGAASGSGSGAASGSGSGGSSGGGQSGNGSGGGGGGIILPDAGGVKPGTEDSCDGIDNDGNGVIDDVDLGQDGICDCLRIATIGKSGTWGEGDVFASWLDDRSTNGAVVLDDVVLTADVLSAHQVIVVQDVSQLGREYAASEIAALEAWVEAGGGLMTLIGYGPPSERGNVNALLEPFGLAYGETPILQRSGENTMPVTEWVGAHPVTDGVEALGVDNGYPVEGEGTVLATEDGWDLLRVVEAGNGRVLAWGDEWITYNSEWVDRSDYQVERFWVNAIKYLTPENECQVPIPDDIE